MKNTRYLNTWKPGIFLAVSALLLGGSFALHAQDAAAAAEPAKDAYKEFMAGPDAAMFTVNNLWILISAALVFIMHLGFSAVESGLCQQ